IRNYRANQIINTFSFFIQPGESMLSVGDGDGYVSMRIKEKTGIEVQGLDILPHQEYRVIGVPLTLYDGNNIPFPDKSFDITAGIFLLHHCEDDTILKEMIRVSKKKIIIVEDVFNNSLERLGLRIFDCVENRTFSSEMPIPHNFRKLKQWEKIFKLRDLELVRSTQFRALPLPVRNQSFCLIKR
ncbi:unnamed protein product, partial [marine sediment metagenome]